MYASPELLILIEFLIYLVLYELAVCEWPTIRVLMFLSNFMSSSLKSIVFCNHTSNNIKPIIIEKNKNSLIINFFNF